MTWLEYSSEGSDVSGTASIFIRKESLDYSKSVDYTSLCPEFLSKVYDLNKINIIATKNEINVVQIIIKRMGRPIKLQTLAERREQLSRDYFNSQSENCDVAYSLRNMNDYSVLNVRTNALRLSAVRFPTLSVYMSNVLF